MSAVVKRELTMKLSIYRLIYILTLSFGDELWVVTEKLNCFLNADMSSLSRMSRLSLTDRDVFTLFGYLTRRPPGQPLNMGKF